MNCRDFYFQGLGLYSSILSFQPFFSCFVACFHSFTPSTIFFLVLPRLTCQSIQSQLSAFNLNQNCTKRISIATLLQLFWNHRIQSLKYRLFDSEKISYWSSNKLVCKKLQRLSFIFLLPELSGFSPRTCFKLVKPLSRII